MTEYNRGDVVLVSFVFSDKTGEKQRPAVIVNSEAYHKSCQEAMNDNLHAVLSLT